MSDTAAAVAAPAAPTETVATPAAPEAPPAAEATPASPAKGKSRARDLAGKFLSGGGAQALEGERGGTPPEGVADAAVEAQVAKVKAAKATEKTDATVEDVRAAEDAKMEKSWREIHRRKKQQRDAKQAIEAERSAIAAEKARVESAKAEAAADAELRRTDPPAWLEKHGFDFQEVAVQAVQKQQLTPEQKAQKAEADALRAELAKEREAREALERETREVLEERKRARAAEANQKALSQLRSEVTTEWAAAKAEFPTLAEHYTPEDIAEAATQLRIDRYNKTCKRDASGRVIVEGQDTPLDEVFAFMEKNARDLKERFSRQSAASALAGDGAERTERETVATEKVAKTRAKVGPPVTNQVSATRASPPKPLSENEKRARAVAKAAEVLGPRR